MRAPRHEVRVVHMPVEPGSDLEVPYVCIRTNEPGCEEVSPIFWGLGWAERRKAAARAADLVTRKTGVIAYGFVPPCAETVRLATNPRRALDHMLRHGFTHVADAITGGQPGVTFMGNSLSGPGAIHAAANSNSRGAAVLSPAGVHNRLLGPNEVVRAAKLGGKLLGATVRQHIGNRDMGFRHLIPGGIGDVTAMRERFPTAMRFVVSDAFEDATVEAASILGERDAIIVGSPDADACFPRQGYVDRLGKMVYPVEGPHACILGKSFEDQMTPLADWVAVRYAADLAVSMSSAPPQQYPTADAA